MVQSGATGPRRACALPIIWPDEILLAIGVGIFLRPCCSSASIRRRTACAGAQRRLRPAVHDCRPPRLPRHRGGRGVLALGVELRLVKLPAERGLINANAGIEDGDLARITGLEKQYPNLVRVPEKLVDLDFTAFSKQRLPELGGAAPAHRRVHQLENLRAERPGRNVITADSNNCFACSRSIASKWRYTRVGWV